MEDVFVIPNLGVTENNDPVPVVPTRTDFTEDHSRCSRGHPPSSRAVRMGQAINFFLYGITLLIPGVAMIIVYFVVFRIPAGDIRWSPADAFVITGTILVGFSIVSEVIAVWQFCMSRHESDGPSQDTTIRNQQYSDAPPSYDGIAIDLLDLVVVSVSQRAQESPPSFESCFPNNRPLPGLENITFENVQTDDDDFPPPPKYHEVIKQKETKKRLPVVINQKNESAKFATSDNSTSDNPPKDST